MVAQYADACNLFARNGVDQLTHKLEVLRGHCEALGRDYDEIEKTAIDRFDLSPEGVTTTEVIDHIRKFAEIGIEHFILSIGTVSEIEPIERFGREVVPQF